MGVKRKSRCCLSAVILSAALQADGFLCFTGSMAGGGGSSSTAVVSMSSLNQASSTLRSPSSSSPRRPSRGASSYSPSGTPSLGSFSRCRSGDLFKLNLSPYEEYMATRNKEAKGESVAPEQHEKASLFERYMKSREKQATLSPAEKEKSIFEEYSQSRPTPSAAPTEEVKELSPYEEYMEKRRRVEAAEAATTAEEKAKASLFKKYLAWRGLTAEEEAKLPKDERAAEFAKYLASRIKARVSVGSGGRIGRWLAPLFKILPGGKKRAEKQAALEESEEDSEDTCQDGEEDDAAECLDESPMPINGEGVVGGPDWSLDVEYTEEEKIAMFDDYMASREKVKAASAQVTPEDVETVSAYGEYMASRARKEAALAGMAPEEKTRSLFDDYMASRDPKKAKARDGVVELTKSTFDAAVLDPTKHAFVYFSAPWCVHCQNLDEDFAELGKIFEAQSSSIVIAKVNAIEEKELKVRCGVKKYPTLQYYPAEQGGKVEVYTGARDVESMADFLDHMNLHGRKQPPQPSQQQQQQTKKKPPGGKHVGSGGMADTRDPTPVNHADPRKSISSAPSFEEYLKSRQ